MAVGLDKVTGYMDSHHLPVVINRPTWLLIKHIDHFFFSYNHNSKYFCWDVFDWGKGNNTYITASLIILSLGLY